MHKEERRDSVFVRVGDRGQATRRTTVGPTQANFHVLSRCRFNSDSMEQCVPPELYIQNTSSLYSLNSTAI